MPFPIEPLLPEIVAALANAGAAVVVAPPGAGKTTIVPPALLDAPWLAGKKILLLEPRRLAARGAASRMAAARAERIGETIGLRMRLDTRVSAATRIEVVTEGILTRLLQDDPALESVGLVIFDEFHERSLYADTGLALTLAARELLRPDLRILVMSATLDGAAVSRLLDGAPVLKSEGRAFPVEIRHRAPRAGARLEGHVTQVIREALAEAEGSLLVFLPGAGEIRRVESQLLAGALPVGVSVHPLHGTLPQDAQDAAIAPAARGARKIVLATSIAETSLTIEGIRVVIDGGLTRVPRFAAGTGMTRLDTVRVSRASAEQRAGRAGRLEPGIAMRCWSAADDAGLLPFSRPEILDADLAPLALDLAAAGYADPAALRWLDAPPAAAFAQARELSALLGAFDAAGRLTAHGQAMAELGAHPRLAHLLIRARDFGAATAARGAALVALLEERDLLRAGARDDGGYAPVPVDIRVRLDAVERDLDDAMLAGASLDRGALARVRQMAGEWRARLGARPRASDAPEDAGLLLALAYPDRVARRRDAAGRFLLRNGRGAFMPAHDPLAREEWIVALHLDDAGREGKILLASPLDPADLLAHAGEQVTIQEEVVWDDAAEAVVARRRTMLGALTLSESRLKEVAPERIVAVFHDMLRRRGLDALPWSDTAIALRQRLAFVHALDSAWPDVSDPALLATLDLWLSPLLGRVTRRGDLERADLGGALLTLLDWEQRRALDVVAPERIEVPSGSRIAVDYTDPSAPVLAVRLQEVFGLADTPRVGDGKVPLVMHLLSPARRPMQVTRDLASFWKTGYFDVRKDLRGRYPKHRWPEDPLEAKPGMRRPRDKS